MTVENTQDGAISRQQGKVFPSLNQELEGSMPTGCVIEKVGSVSALEDAFNSGLIALYKDAFGKPPYSESYTDNEVKTIFFKYFNHGLLFVVRREGDTKDSVLQPSLDEEKNLRTKNQVVGLGAALPMSVVPDIQDTLSATGFDTSNCWYVADIAVREDLRRQGLGRKLMLECLVPDCTAIVRTSVDSMSSHELYKSLGARQISNAYQDVEMQRDDGEVRTDRRLFFALAK